MPDIERARRGRDARARARSCTHALLARPLVLGLARRALSKRDDARRHTAEHLIFGNDRVAQCVG